MCHPERAECKDTDKLLKGNANSLISFESEGLESKLTKVGGMTQAVGLFFAVWSGRGAVWGLARGPPKHESQGALAVSLPDCLVTGLFGLTFFLITPANRFYPDLGTMKVYRLWSVLVAASYLLHKDKKTLVFFCCLFHLNLSLQCLWF